MSAHLQRFAILLGLVVCAYLASYPLTSLFFSLAPPAEPVVVRIAFDDFRERAGLYLTGLIVGWMICSEWRS